MNSSKAKKISLIGSVAIVTFMVSAPAIAQVSDEIIVTAEDILAF